MSEKERESCCDLQNSSHFYSFSRFPFMVFIFHAVQFLDRLASFCSSEFNAISFYLFLFKIFVFLTHFSNPAKAILQDKLEAKSVGKPLDLMIYPGTSSGSWKYIREKYRFKKQKNIGETKR